MALNLIAPRSVHALAGDLTFPSLSFSSEFPEAFRTNVMAAISKKECKFLDGHFVNANTTLHYGGSTESLNHLLARLAEIDGVRVVVTFVKEPGGPAWTLSHLGWGSPGTLSVQINTAAASIEMEKLAITADGHSKNR
jgi:hypothetical protein